MSQTHHEISIRQACARRGVTVELKGSVIRLRGRGVEVTSTSWNQIRLSDVEPVLPGDRPAIGGFHQTKA